MGLVCLESILCAVEQLIGLVTEAVPLLTVFILGIVSLASPLACFLLEL